MKCPNCGKRGMALCKPTIVRGDYYYCIKCGHSVYPEKVEPVLRKGLNADVVYKDPSYPALIKHVSFEDAWIVEGKDLVFELLHFSPTGFVFRCKGRSDRCPCCGNKMELAIGKEGTLAEGIKEWYCRKCGKEVDYDEMSKV